MMEERDPPAPIVIPRPEHCLSRKNIDPDALKVMLRLHRHGYKAYLVGGGVRDLLLGSKPKDFDVSTDARPGSNQKIVQQLPHHRKAFPPCPHLFSRKQDHRGVYVPEETPGADPRRGDRGGYGKARRQHLRPTL